VWHLDGHLDRMFASGAIYHMDLPFSKDELVRATKDVIRANALDACYIRPIAFRGYGEMGVNPLKAPVNVAIAVWPWGAYLGEDALEQGVRVKVSSWKRHDQNSLPSAAKATGGYLGSILAKVESLKAGYDEAIMLNQAGVVAEGSGENVFVVKDGVLSTPATGVGALGGITRGAVIRIARDQGYEVMERDLVRTDLYLADEVFFTGTAAELTPIREVDDRTVGAGHRGPVTKELQDVFFAATRGDDPRYVSWLSYVDD
jgi:branched-chain amino acid aminotransferase